MNGYSKGLYADSMMREDMGLIQKEQDELEKQKAELEGQLARRLLVEKVFHNGQGIEILTIIPLGEQLHPIHRGG